MNNVEKTMLECSELQTKALHELNDLSCRVTMLDAALGDVEQHPLLAGMMTASIIAIPKRNTAIDG